jgi:hypothetical protein
MRLNRLDLVRYGKFTDKRIDLGARPQDKPDLHIIYGPNEAGKSTALAAFLDLLFGIDPRSHFNFMHPYATMRIGAILDLAGEAKEFLRVKRPHNSLLDAGEQPISEAARSASRRRSFRPPPPCCSDSHCASADPFGSDRRAAALAGGRRDARHNGDPTA